MQRRRRFRFREGTQALHMHQFNWKPSNVENDSENRVKRNHVEGMGL